MELNQNNGKLKLILEYLFLFLFDLILLHGIKFQNHLPLFEGVKIRVTLKMEAKNLPPVMSRNTVAEIKGSKYPEQVLVIEKSRKYLYV